MPMVGPARGAEKATHVRILGLVSREVDLPKDGRSVQRRLLDWDPLEHLSPGARAGQDSFMDLRLHYPA
jgi:hypothetical protein